MKQAVAGTLESGDIMITIGPGKGLEVNLQTIISIIRSERGFDRKIAIG